MMEMKERKHVYYMYYEPDDSVILDLKKGMILIVIVLKCELLALDSE